MDIERLDSKQQIEIKIFALEQIIGELEILKNSFEKDWEYWTPKRDFNGITRSSYTIVITTVEGRISSYKDKVYKYKDELYQL